ncbi:MAG: hypothetical protein Q8K33_01490 [Cypionkella sp.]|uniref:hypothetical protein n=1 Tax=Cypionkella sp. TaxID=2811411 RepID=UPI0027303A92|nr:hypothetical protein [Cypionkella sp.]MDP2047554.1 hypothetical protein [Cypionkella sp.]
MSAIYGISGLVDGFINGRNVRNSWADRKDDKARQKRMDDLTFTQDARSAEEHKRRMKVYDENASDWERGRADNDRVREIYDQGKADYEKQQADASSGAMGATPDTSVSTSGAQGVPDPVAGVAANLGIPMGATQDRFAESMPTPEALLQKYAADPTPVRSDRAEAGNLDPRQKIAVRADAAGGAGGMAGASGVVPMGAMEPEFIVAPPQSRAIEDELAASGNVGPRYIPNPRYQPPAPAAAAAPQPFQRNPPGGDPRRQSAGPTLPQGYGVDMAPDRAHVFGQSVGGDAAEIGKRTLSGFGAVAENAAEAIPGALRPVSQALDTATRYATGTNTMEDRARDSGQNVQGIYDDPAKRAQAVEFMKARERGENPESIVPGFAVKKSAAPVPAPAGTSRPVPMEGVGVGPRVGKASPAPDSSVVKAADEALASTSPATQEALQAAAVKAGPLGIKPTEKAGAEHAKKFAQSFEDYYLQNVAPKVMEEYIRQGDIQKATGFQEFLDRKETRAGMENWVKAAHAVTLGDYDTFAENMLEAYNRLDYFPDGTTIVKEQSGIVYGKDGKASGARVTFKDEASGDTWEKVYGSVDDMVKEGMTLLAPEMAFEHYAAQNEASKPKPADPAAAQKDMEKRVDDAAKVIFEKSIGLDGQLTIPYDEARKQAAAAIAGPQGQQQLQGPPAPPPIAYRPIGG